MAIIIVDKVENFMPENKPFIIINYKHLYKTKVENYFNSVSKYYNFFSKLHYITYFKS